MMLAWRLLSGRPALAWLALACIAVGVAARGTVSGSVTAVERQLAAQPGRYCHGDTPTLADCVLVPQVFNAQRFNCRTEHVPNVMRVFETCLQQDVFSKTHPDACPDAF